jgi:hypothetical protein
MLTDYQKTVREAYAKRKAAKKAARKKARKAGRKLRRARMVSGRRIFTTIAMRS